MSFTYDVVTFYFKFFDKEEEVITKSFWTDSKKVIQKKYGQE